MKIMNTAVFLDYASTCPVVKYPQQFYRNTLGEGYFFNPNTNYAYKEKRLLSEAENRVKKAIGAKGGKVIFGGTSSQLIENLMAAVICEQIINNKEPT
nr:MAG TPA: putative cysteine desulfurase 2 [Herelleviridae sp.]